MASKPVVVSVTLVMLAAMLLLCLPRDAAADSAGMLKYIGCFQKLADASGACGKKKNEFSALEQAFGVEPKHKSDREKKGLCCKYSTYLDCYMKNVRHNCGDGAGKYALKFLESTTQKYVRSTCHKFDSRKCSSAVAPSASSLVVICVSAAVLAFSLLL
uniref:Putative conserved plasma membrane protein n=1 Tax=Amblyomma aureolatum TaxID=187763 RepID=A0A1E1WYM3_9ACAR